VLSLMQEFSSAKARDFRSGNAPLPVIVGVSAAATERHGVEVLDWGIG
jgi:hypothetical protein